MANPTTPQAQTVDEKSAIDAAHRTVNKRPSGRNGRGLMIALLIVGGLLVASLYAYATSNGGVATKQQRASTANQESAATRDTSSQRFHGYGGVPPNAIITPPPTTTASTTPAPGLPGALPASPGVPPGTTAPGTAGGGGSSSAAMRAYIAAINSDGTTATTTTVSPSQVPAASAALPGTSTPAAAAAPQLHLIYGGAAGGAATSPASAGGGGAATTVTGSGDLMGVIAQAKAAIASEIAAHANAASGTTQTSGSGGIIADATSALSSALASGPAAFNLPTGNVPTGRSDGRMHTPILNPATYELPIGTRIPMMLTAALDSGLAGPICATVDEDMRDPRSGALIMPRGSQVCGLFTGLAPQGTHLSIQWRWLIYPDLQQRALVDVATTDEEGNNGLAGRVDTHMIPYFRNTLIGSIFSAAGQIIAGITAHGAPLFGGGGTPPTLQANTAIPTLHANIATPFSIVLQRDYTAPTPYQGHS